jgi:diguanylate cyclase (GGDEF)-like protein/PAS domain S-box-containing protein
MNGKNRVALALTALFTLAIILVTALQLQAIRSSTGDVLAAQQNTLVTRVADEIDEKFRVRLNALAVVATRFDPDHMQSAVQAQAVLGGHQVLPTMFDHLFLFSPQGQVLASEPYGSEFTRVNVRQRPYFQDALTAVKPAISEPYLSVTDNSPYVMMTAPLFDAHGRLVGVLGGAISLLKPTFMGRIASTPVGETGYFYVMTRGSNPTIVSHPDRARIMSPTFKAAIAHNPGVTRAQAGFQGTAEGENSRGVRSLMTFKQLKEVDWVLTAVLPSQEAFGPIAQAQKRIVVMASVVAVLLGALTWLLVYWLLVPLEALREHVQARRTGSDALEALPVRRLDEIGVLTDAFNELMHTEHATRKALAANESRLRLITDNLPALIGYVDTRQRYRFNNKLYEEWFGVEREAFYGRTMRETLGAEMYEQLRPDIDHALAGYVVCQERELALPGGKRIVLSTFMPDYGPKSEVLGFYVLTQDITAQKQAQRRLDFLAHHDTLTELPNRASFNARLTLAIARTRRHAKPFALMYLDIDKFKSINDTHGHGTGDALLKAFASRLQECVRGTDIVGRLGGDEFVVLAEDLGSPADGAAFAAKIIAAMRLPFALESMEIRTSASIGVAICFQEHSHLTGAAVLEWADQALYLAKQGGRNRYRIANADAVVDADSTVSGAAALA